nr:hypothetical protein [uncultured archaeon]
MSFGKKENKEKYVKLSLSSIARLLKKNNVEDLKIAIKILKESTNLSADEILNLILEEHGEILIPISIFSNRKLSSLQILVKYLKENLNLSFKNISDLTNRDQRTIWTTYNVAIKKFNENIIIKDFELKINVSKFSNRQLSTLEVLVSCLKFDFKLKNIEISRLLSRDSRTIWTVVNNIERKKIGNKKE